MQTHTIVDYLTVIVPIEFKDMYPCPVCDIDLDVNMILDGKSIHSVTCEDCDHVVIFRIKKLNIS